MGLMKLHVIEGNRFSLDGGSVYGNVPKVLWEKWTPADHLNRIPFASRALLMQTDAGQNILFEAGIGAFFEPKMKERFGIADNRHHLLENLNGIGVKPEDIDAAVISHLHFDHCGGLLTSYGEEPRLVFSNARYYLSRKHWEYTRQPHIRERGSYVPLIRERLEKSGKVNMIEGSTHPDLPDVRFYYSDGHTLGMLLSELPGPVVFTADLVPAVPWVHLPITMGFDRFGEKIVDEKEVLYKELLPRNPTLFFTHDLETPMGKLTFSEGKYRIET